MLRGIAQLFRVLALLAGLGAATWAAFGVIATSNEFGSHHPGDLGGPKTALFVLAAAAALYIALGLFLRDKT